MEGMAGEHVVARGPFAVLLLRYNAGYKAASSTAGSNNSVVRGIIEGY
jgi:hypothetical protein